MAVVGKALLVLAMLSCGWGIGASVYGGVTRRREWVDSGRHAMYAVAGMALFAFAILDVAFITSDFSYNIVASGSSTTTPVLFRAAAIWATQQGSLLLWVTLLSCWSSLALFLTRRRVREIVPYAQATLFGLVLFFAGLNVFAANPFDTTSPAPSEGAGLDPLLRHVTMMVHPPMLYSGYTLMMVPFAFAVGALISGRLGAEWIQVTRRFALGAWLCLGVGLLLGARWSYTELGWGGYWAWDPVENAALMPWLCGTAYIHSIMIQEKRGMLKVWNASLVLAAGTLAIIGTFLVRSGILSSIHAFVSDPTLNFSFVGLIALMVIGSIGLVSWRRESLKSEARLDSLLSREAVFLFQNLVLVALAAVVFWITFFPLISEAITGTQVSVGPTAFRPFVVPLALLVVVLSGIGPIIAWRRVTVAKLRRSFAFPTAATLVVAIVLAITDSPGRHVFAYLMFCAGSFVLAAVGHEFVRGIAARRRLSGEAAPVAFVQLVRRNRRRYGGYIVHAGVALALIGVAGSTSFQHSREATIGPGQSVMVDGYRVTYLRPTAAAGSEKISLGAWLAVSRNGQRVATLHTSYGLYASQDALAPIGRFFDGASTESRVGLQSSLTKDIWTVINPNIAPLGPLVARGDRVLGKALNDALAQPAGPARTRALTLLYQARDIAIRGITERFVSHPWKSTFLLIVSPIVMWLWLGAIIAALGGLIALWPARPPRRRRPPASAGRQGEGASEAPPSPRPRERELVAPMVAPPRPEAT
ncbi:MAG TPA: cytochrome c-type biogenesis CcmF C-terminal domain-containing protein [Solirubrobacteraceae bacterium]|nr:cytochrome c-type biogenesis CcmF C-terminal domain-containing protein [Solirubrobacteraceae bacterium]